MPSCLLTVALVMCISTSDPIPHPSAIADGKPPTRFAPISDGATSDATRPSECKHSWLSLLPRFARIVDKTFNEVKADTFNEVKADTFNEVQVFH